MRALEVPALLRRRKVGTEPSPSLPVLETVRIQPYIPQAAGFLVICKCEGFFVVLDAVCFCFGGPEVTGTEEWEIHRTRGRNGFVIHSHQGLVLPWNFENILL